MNSRELKFYSSSIDYILEVQNQDGSIPWEKGKKLDPWDHIEAAMGLSIAGNKVESEKAFIWLSDNQLDDGSWYSEYIESVPQTKRRETNFSAYLATGLFHYFLIFEDKKFLERLFPSLEKAMEFVISSQTSKGDIYWAKEEGIEILDDSLITGSSSIYKSLECAIAIYNILGKPIENLKESRLSLKNSINNNPERYDRSWESKSRYSMDWYYPILCGVYDDKEGISIIDSKWSDFIVLGMGCKCVVEEPWVTVAESSELVIALVKLGLIEKAEYIFNSLHQWRDEDGLYWTGYVYTDEKFWPVEKPTWTAGAVLLAADSLYRFTRGSDLFLKDWATNN
ncbi:prenyltransferase [Gammaproteobacteria bacterium]|nr:prenyltransferase [Gammaproteobacteria bacterium]